MCSYSDRSLCRLHHCQPYRILLSILYILNSFHTKNIFLLKISLREDFTKTNKFGGLTRKSTAQSLEALVFLHFFWEIKLKRKTCILSVQNRTALIFIILGSPHFFPFDIKCREKNVQNFLFPFFSNCFNLGWKLIKISKNDKNDKNKKNIAINSSSNNI